MERKEKSKVQTKINRRKFLKYAGATAATVLGGFPAILRGQPRKIILGISHDITGPMAPEGKAQKDAYILAIQEWNKKGGISGQQIEYIYRNHGGDPLRAAGNAKLFIESGCCAACGCSYSTAGIAEMKVFAPAQIPMIGGGAAQANFQKGPDGKVYYFAGVGSDIAMTKGLLTPAIYQGCKKLAILSVNNTWGKDLRDGEIEWIRKEYGPKYGVTCIKTIEADVKATDLTPQILELKSVNPDGIICNIYSGSVAAIVRAFADLNYHPLFVNYWSAAEAIWMKGDPKLLYNNYSYSMASGLREDTMAKKKEFMEKFGYEPVMHWVNGYDSANLTLMAIKQVGPNPIAIRDWLATKSYGIPVLSGCKGKTCGFKDEEVTWLGVKGTFYSLYEGSDYAFLRVDNEGKIQWLDIK